MRKKKVGVNVGKGKVMRCSMYVDVGRMDMRLNFKPLEEVDCFKYLGSQVAADEGCANDVVHEINERYRAWWALTSASCSRGLGIKAKKCL